MKVFTYGAEGIEYLRAQLSDGHAFARELLARLSLDDGILTATLPSDTDKQALTRWKVGGVIRQEPAARACSKLIRHFLTAVPGSIFVVEHRYISTTDEWFARWVEYGDNYFTVGSEVYLFATSSDFDETVLREFEGASGGWLFIGALCEAADLPPLTRGARHDLSLLKDLADRARHVITTAYDNEAFLVWSPAEGLKT